MNDTISILLAAGFSAPMGYPIGNTLNNSLVKLTNALISFSSDGRLVKSKDGKKPDFGNKTSYDNEFEFCLVLIKHYSEKNDGFDYEKFYDYLLDEVKNDKEAESLAKDYLNGVKYGILIGALKNIFNQLVSHFLKDTNDIKWYDNQPYLIGNTYSGYTGFMRYLESIPDDKIVNIHTLNHDLFFESFNNTDFLAGCLCDGFSELSSPYYGDLKSNKRTYKCRLEYFTGEYNEKYRLYKLHGSVDYGIYYKREKGLTIPEKYIKTRYGIGFSEIFKEQKNEDGDIEYDSSWINYHSDFLTGTTSKIERYDEPLLFNELFKMFRENLNNADKLIIVGYGAKDSEINNIIKEQFDFKNKPVFIVDPFAGNVVEEFAKEIGAKVIKKQLEQIENSDFE